MSVPTLDKDYCTLSEKTCLKMFVVSFAEEITSPEPLYCDN